MAHPLTFELSAFSFLLLRTNMQFDSLQADTQRTDSITLSSPADTIIPDTIIQGIIIPDTIIPDNTGSQAKDSLTIQEIKDSVVPLAAKKIIPKIAKVDSLIKESNQAPLQDSVYSFSNLATDSIQNNLFSFHLQQADTGNRGGIMENRTENTFPGQVRNAENSSWIVVLFLVIFILLSWVNVSYSKRIRQFFEAFLSNRYIRQMVREEFVFSHPTSIALSASFLLTSSLLLMQANSYFEWNIFLDGNSPVEMNSFTVFIKFLFGLTIFYIGKIILIRISGSLFSAEEEITEYLFNLFLFNNILGLVLLPLVMIVVFANSLSPQNIIIFSGTLVLLAFLFRLVKCTYIGNISTKFSKSYIILYICTLEILPLFLLIKTFAGRN